MDELRNQAYHENLTQFHSQVLETLVEEKRQRQIKRSHKKTIENGFN
jgi:hypothetical protein